MVSTMNFFQLPIRKLYHMQLQTCCKGSVRCIILLLLVLLHTGAFAARKPYSNTVFGFDKGSIKNGVFKVTDSNTGTEMTVTNASSVTYYNPSRQNYYKPYLRLKNKGQTTITFKFTDPALSLRAISYETNRDYNSWFGAYNNTYAFGAQYTTGIENFTHSDDGLTWTCTFSNVDNIQIMSVTLDWDPVDEVIEHAPMGVEKNYTGTSQSLFELDPNYYAKSGLGNGEIGYKCKYNKTTGAAMSMLFAGGEGTEKLYKGYATSIKTYTVKWWYEGNSFKFSDVDIMFTTSQGSESNPLGTFTSEIKAMANNDVVEPQAKVLSYTGSPQVLVTAASSSNGKALYKLSDWAGWSEDIPTGTDAGTYQLYWIIESTNSSYDGYGTRLDPKGPVEITINKVNIPEVTAPQALTPVYNTQQLLLASGGSATGGDILFRVGADGEWTTTPTASEVNLYTVYWYVKGDKNHNDLGSETDPYGELTTQIQKASYDMNGVRWTATTYTYDGTAKQDNVIATQFPSPDITATYTYKDANNQAVTEAVNAGTYTVTATFTTSSGNFVNPAPMSTTFTIEPFNLQGAHVDGSIADQNYTGAAIAPMTANNHPTLSMKQEDPTTVIPFTAYTTTYLNNVNAGTNTATATMTANNTNPNFVGSKALRFSIKKKSVEVGTVDQTISYGETISSNTDKATLYDAVSGHTLSAVTLRPSLSYENYGVGTHQKVIVADDVHIKDASNNDVTANYVITCPESRRGALTVTVKSGDSFTISGLQAEYQGTGHSAVTPDVTSMIEVAVYNGSTKLVKNADYTVSYTNNVLAGTATATFTFMGNYEGSVSQNFEIYYQTETFSRQSTPQYNYCTYYHPSEKLYVKDADAKVYFCTLNNNNDKVVLNEVSSKVINAGTPVMLRTPSTAKAVKLYAYSGANETYTGTNALTGVTTAQVGQPIPTNSRIYVFDGDCFLWANKGEFVANKAYINGSTHSLARTKLPIGYGDDDTTAIFELNDDESANEQWYDLMGNRIAKPTRKGLYILNGKKTVVK